MKLSDKIIKLRKAKGWSQEDFAEKLNCPGRRSVAGKTAQHFRMQIIFFS